MRILYLALITTILSSCSGGFVKKIEKQDNQDEIVAFKHYLLKENIMDDFKEYKILYSQNDSVIKQFFLKYDIKAIYIEPCNKEHFTPQPHDHFKNCGNKISLSFNNTYIEPNHSLIFDYSDEELQLKDEVGKKHKIADRIFVF